LVYQYIGNEIKRTVFSMYFAIACLKNMTNTVVLMDILAENLLFLFQWHGKCRPVA